MEETNVDGDGDERDGKRRVPVSPNENEERVASRTGASVLLESAARSLRMTRRRVVAVSGGERIFEGPGGYS